MNWETTDGVHKHSNALVVDSLIWRNTRRVNWKSISKIPPKRRRTKTVCWANNQLGQVIEANLSIKFIIYRYLPANEKLSARGVLLAGLLFRTESSWQNWGLLQILSLLTVSASSPINNKTNRMIVYRFMDINRQFTGHSEEQDREIVFDKLIMLYMLNGQ